MKLKKTIASVMAAAICLSTFTALPASVYAVKPVTPIVASAENKGEDEVMKAALALAKSRLTIPEEYSDFSCTTSQRHGMKSFTFTWKRSESWDDRYTVTVTGDMITGYSSPTSYDGSVKTKISPFTPDQLEKKAADWLAKVCPETAGFIKKTYIGTYLNSNTVTVTFGRICDGLDVSDNSVGVSLDKETGNVVSMNSSWWQNAVFVPAASAVSQEAIAEVYKKDINIKPWYRISTDNKGKKTAKVVYQPLNSPVYDAATGKKSTYEQDYAKAMNTDNYAAVAPAMYDDDMVEEVEEEAVFDAGGGISFTEQELAAAADFSEMLTSDQFRNIAVKDKYMGITSKYMVSNFNINRSENAECGYCISCTMTINNEKQHRNVYITADAKSGKIISFNADDNSSGKAQLDVKKSAALAAQAAKYYYGDIYGEFRASPDNTGPIPTENGKPVKVTSRTMEYNRYVNNIQVSGNYINIRVNSSGEVTYVNCCYDKDVDFGDGLILSKENAIDLLLRQKKLTLKYDGFTDLKSVPHTYLHYSMDSWNVNAVSGRLCDYFGLDVREPSNNDIRYTDLDKSAYKSEIETLCLYGVNVFDGDKFDPTQKMTKSELDQLMKIITGYSYVPIPLAAVEDGSGTSAAPDPKKTLCTRKDLAMALTRAAGVDSCAKYSSIFKSPFKDIPESDPDMGYFALAYGMGALKPDSQGKIYPNAYVTREYAYHCAYNYIKRNSE